MEWGKAIKELGFDCMALAVHRVAYDAPLVHCLPLSRSSTCLMILSRWDSIEEQLINREN
jgi:hypothetical protein